MAKFYLIMSWVCGVLGVSLLVISILGYCGVLDPYLEPYREDALHIHVDATVKSFGEAKVGQELVVPFTFKNNWGRPCKIVGGNFG